jgi:hypothetical protein
MTAYEYCRPCGRSTARFNRLKKEVVFSYCTVCGKMTQRQLDRFDEPVISTEELKDSWGRVA